MGQRASSCTVLSSTSQPIKVHIPYAFTTLSTCVTSQSYGRTSKCKYSHLFGLTPPAFPPISVDDLYPAAYFDIYLTDGNSIILVFVCNQPIYIQFADCTSSRHPINDPCAMSLVSLPARITSFNHNSVFYEQACSESKSPNLAGFHASQSLGLVLHRT